MFVCDGSVNQSYAYHSVDANAIANIFPYVLLNILLVCGSLFKLSKTMTKKQIIVSCLLSSLIFSIFILVEILILQQSPLNNLSMPLVELAGKFSWLLYFTLFVTFVAMLSSLLASCNTIFEKTQNSKNKRFWQVVILIAMLCCSFLGFSTLVEYSYLILGYLSCLLILVLIFKA